VVRGASTSQKKMAAINAIQKHVGARGTIENFQNKKFAAEKSGQGIFEEGARPRKEN